MYIGGAFDLIQLLMSISDDSKKAKIQYLYNKYYAILLSVCRSKLIKSGNKNYSIDSYDIVQNVFLNLIQYLPDVIEYEKAYIFTILDNEIYKFLRKETYNENIDDYENELAEEDFFESFNTREQLQRVSKIITSLDEKYRIPMILKYEFDLSVENISNRLDLPIRTVYYRLKRGQQIIKDSFFAEEETHEQ